MKRPKRGTNIVAMAAVVGLFTLAGCKRDVRLAGRELRDVTVRTVTQYGITLDPSATAQQVAFVLLRAIREDFEATSPAERKEALDKQFAVCAANEIARRGMKVLTRAEAIHNVVYFWTPTVSHYAGDFEQDWAAAKARLIRTRSTPAGGENGASQCQVLLEVDDPDGDPNARVVLGVGLIQDEGYWRVLRLGFATSGRSIGGRSASAARPPSAPAVGDDPATPASGSNP